MDRSTRSSKIMETEPKVTPTKRGRKKKIEIMNGADEQEQTVQQNNVQNIRRSLRGKVSIELQNQGEPTSNNNNNNTTEDNDELQENIESNYKVPEIESLDIKQSSNEYIKVLEDGMSSFNILEENKYPLVVLHQLTVSDLSPKQESLPSTISTIGEKIKEENPSESKVGVELMEIVEEPIKSLQVIDIMTENEIKQEPVEPKCDEQVIIEKEENTNLRRSRRLKSIFIETATVSEVIQVPKIESTLQQQSPPLPEIKLEEKDSKMEKIEDGRVKTEEVYESIDVENDARLSQFITIKDNIYLKSSDKIICKINKTMKCDCTITEEEIKNGELGCTFNCINRLLFIECGPKCRCGEYCDNQQFQRYNYSPISVFKTEKKGFGIRADADIPPETFIIEYVGEVLNNKQFEKRATKYSKDKNRHYYFMALRSNAVIDATVKGNISRFINHSCDPNAITQKWTINGELRVGFFSVRYIKKGEEITFDYQFQRYGKEAQRCFCESENCRGWIGENPESDEEISENLESNKEKKEIKSKKVPITKAKPKSKIIENDDGTADAKDIETKKTEQNITKSRRKLTFSEDLEIEEQIKDLTKSGLKNRAHTIALARLVVRAKSIESRSCLLKILLAGQDPCKRLFLDYNGLKLLHTWMCDISVKSSVPDLCLCIELLNALSSLPVTNKTVLRDSKVLERVERWKNINIEKKKLSKEERKQAKANKKKNKVQTTIPIDSAKEESVFMMTYDVLEELPTMKLILKEKATALLQKWEILKEDFRIPKKQKQENRKEHEKEAGMEEDIWNDSQQTTIMNNKIKNRFGQEGGNSSSGTPRGNPPYYSTSTSSQYQSSYRRFMDPLEKQHRRKLFEKQELEKRMWMEHESNCAMFGLPSDTPITNIPVKVNRVTGECYQIYGQKVPNPPNFHEFKYEPLTLSTNPDDYHLPPIDLPEQWRFAIDLYGRIYYYHEKIRISQWEAPIKILPLFSNDDDDDVDINNGITSESYGNLGTPDDDESSTDTEDSEEEELSSLLDMLKRKKRKLNGYKSFEQISTSTSDITSAVEEDLDKRIKLNSRISKMLDNPVKISPIADGVKRKKRRGLVTMMKFIRPRTEEDKLYGRNESRRYKEVKEKLRRQKKKRLQQGEGDSSEMIIDEDDDDEDVVDEACFSNKMVDELDILVKTKHLEKIRKLKTDVEFSDNLRTKKQTSRSMPPSDQSLVKRQFRDDIKEEIAKYLLPFCDDTCTNGRIETDEDYNSLINKLTFSVLTKESKHCAQSNSMLKATDSVKGKTKEFIKKYMSKFEGPYRRKADEQDYSLILNKY